LAGEDLEQMMQELLLQGSFGPERLRKYRERLDEQEARGGSGEESGGHRGDDVGAEGFAPGASRGGKSSIRTSRVYHECLSGGGPVFPTPMAQYRVAADGRRIVRCPCSWGMPTTVRFKAGSLGDAPEATRGGSHGADHTALWTWADLLALRASLVRVRGEGQLRTRSFAFTDKLIGGKSPRKTPGRTRHGPPRGAATLGLLGSEG
jgi:hypothetical protein